MEVGKQHEEEKLDAGHVPRARMEALINAIAHYQDVYPVLQRGVQFLCQELSDVNTADGDSLEITSSIQSFVEAGALTSTVRAMNTNLDSPTFINSCFELLIALINYSEQRMTGSLWETEILVILEKIVHNVVYQNEPTCIQRGIHILSKLVRNLKSIENELWSQLISTTAQAMLTNSVDNVLPLECLLCLRLLFQLKTDGAVPAASTNIVLKTLDQCNRQPTGVSSLFASALVEVIFRISGALRTPQFVISAPILAAALHHYHLTMSINDTHKTNVEKLIEQPLQAAVNGSVLQLIDLGLPPDESRDSEAWLAAFQTAAIKILLGVVWRDEAREFLDTGGISVLVNVFLARSALITTAIETVLAQTLYYVSMHWPDGTWSEIQRNGSGISEWVEVISDRCEDENDNLLQYFLAMVQMLLPCKGFYEAFAETNGMTILRSVFEKHQSLPACTRMAVTILVAVSDICLDASLPVMCSLVAETMFALEANRSSQLECVKSLTVLVSLQSDNNTLLSSQHVRDIVRLMRSKLTDKLFIAEMLDLVANTLLNSSVRASFIDRGFLQVVSKAICLYQWSPTESAGLNARWIVCDIAHKLDISRNLRILEPHANISNGLSFNSPAISSEALDACCCVIGALAFVKPLHRLLIEEGAIRCIVGVLRYAKQELVVRSEDPFVRLVMSCFYALSNLVTQVGIEATDGQEFHSRLLDCGADDAIIGCFEEALRIRSSPPSLIDGGCKLLQAVLMFPISISSEAENRWIAVGTSILQRKTTQQRTRELLFATTLMIFSRGKRSVEIARGQHIKMMKVILGILDDSIEHKSSCTLLQAESTGAIRVLEEIAKASDSLSDILVSRCLGVLGKLVGIFILSPSITAQENVARFDSAIGIFATNAYVNRLINRLDRYMVKEGAMESGSMAGVVEDFKALQALLFSSQAKKAIDAYHPLFGYLAAVVENVTAYAQSLGDNVLFFLELGCLTSQLLSTTQREEVINTALCHFAEDIVWHSMRWMAVLPDRDSSEFMLIVEFVLLRIVSGYTILEPALLIELLEALNYLLRYSECREIVLGSPHSRDLQTVLWALVQTDIARLEDAGDGYDIAVSLLGIISSLVSLFSDKIFSIRSKVDGNAVLVRLCLGALEKFFSESCVSLTKVALMEEVLQTTGIILHHCIQLSAEHALTIIQHQATQHAINMCDGTAVAETKPYKKWCLVILGAVNKSHGPPYAEKMLRLSPNPSALVIGLVGIAVQDSNLLSWKWFVECITMVSGSKDTSAWQSDCCALFGKLQQQSKEFAHKKQATVTNSRLVRKHITDTIAQLSLKYGQLCLHTSQDDTGDCLGVIVQSGLAYYELFMRSPSFDPPEYSTIVSLHLKIARFKIDTERNTAEKSALSIRQLLLPICITDEALADYVDFMTAIYLSPTIRAAASLFLDASGTVLSKSMLRLTTGVVRAPCLEKSLLKCFLSLRPVYASRWESGEIESVLELLKLCLPDKWSQEKLLESVLVLPQGLLHLFELARAALSNDFHAIIMAFVFQHVNDARHKTQRIDELELSAILSMIKRNLAGKVGDTMQRRWREVTGSDVLHSSLEALKSFARRKDCAARCANLGGINALYNVLCAPSQYEDSIFVALEISCYLAGYGADLAHENVVFALQLLLVFVETNRSHSRSRFAYLVLEYFLAVGASGLTLPLIQQCRTQIVPVAARSYEEAEMFIQQLYITRQKIVPRATKQNLVADPKVPPKKSSPLNESEIRGIILESSRSIVQYTNGEENAYVNVKTSEKSAVEPVEFARLRQAINQLGFVLDDPDMAANRAYVRALVPALIEILVLHTETTATICTIMQVFDQIAFVNPSAVISNDITALFSSCSLHHRSSLVFARYLCRFCNSIAAEWRAMEEDIYELPVSLVSLLLDQLQHWKSDIEIVDQGLATLHGLIRAMRMSDFERLHCNDILALLNTVVTPYTSSSPTSQNWLKCVLAAVDKLDKVIVESAHGMISIAIGIIHMFMSHSFMVGAAVDLLVCVYNENRQIPLQHLIELDGVGVLLTCLKLHANDESIAHSCLKLMTSLTSLSDTSSKTVDQLLAAAAAAPILLVSKKNLDNPSLCTMCIKLVHQMVQSFEDRPVQNPLASVLPGDTLKKKSELLTHLLEADVVSLAFDLLDIYSIQGNSQLLGSLLVLLKSLTKDERLRESAEVLHGLQELQQSIDRVREYNFDCVVVELAIDCLVNMACSDRAVGHGWRELAMWLLQLAQHIHDLGTDRAGMCVEKLIGILGRLAVDSTISKSISPKGSFTILELLVRVGADRSLEQALFGLLSTLCEDVAIVQILIVYDIIPITAERFVRHIKDEDTLLNSLCFFDQVVLNIGESYSALQDESVFEALGLVTRTYPETTGSQVYRIASIILEKVSALAYRSARSRPTAAKPMKAVKPQSRIPDSTQPFQTLLREGAKFRVLWEARPDTVESVHVKLAPSGDYLLFRRKSSSQQPRVERVFVSQLEVCPQRSLNDSKSPSSPSKKVLAQCLIRENFDGDCVLRLKVRDEDVLIKTSSTRERVYWDQALQWLVSTRTTRVHSPTNPSNFP